jgi:hypothetical protein
LKEDSVSDPKTTMPEVTDLGAIPGTEGGPAAPNLVGVPVTEIKPDVGMLSLRYVDGVPQLVVSGGTTIPASLTVVDTLGTPVAKYERLSPAQPAAISGRDILADINAVIGKTVGK